MFTTILISLLVYSVCSVVFLIGWSRWQDRMAHMDAASEANCKGRRIVSAGVRPYPE